MREILFKAKCADNGKWLLSVNLIQEYRDGIKKVYFPKGVGKSECFEIIPDTLGQYTGLTDKNGKKIFGGDIVRDEQSGYEYAIKWFTDYACYALADRRGNMVFDAYEIDMFLNDLIVVGNIHDNSEYMEVSK